MISQPDVSGEPGQAPRTNSRVPALVKGRVRQRLDGLCCSGQRRRCSAAAASGLVAPRPR